MKTAEILALQTTQERAMLKAFEAVLADIRDNASLAQITRLLDDGRVDDVIAMLRLDPSTWQPISETIRGAYIEGGLNGVEQLGKIPIGGVLIKASFDVRSYRAEQWLTQRSSEFITEVAAPQRDLIKAYLTDGLARGINPKTAALDLVGRIDPITKRRLGGIIGMTSQQAQWISNARGELMDLDPSYFNRQLRDRRFDKVIREAMESGTPLKASVLDGAITRMQQRTLKYRADTIARTESITALRAGQFESLEQAVDVGDVAAGDVKKTWDATGDGNTRPEHAAADGQSVGMNESFIVGGEMLRYPGDPMGSAGNVINCRCRLNTSIDFVGQYKRNIKGFG